MGTRGKFVLGIVAATLMFVPAGFASVQVTQTPLSGKAVPKYVEAVPTFVGARVKSSTHSVSMEEFQQKILPASMYTALPSPFNAGTYVWGYNVNSSGPLYPAYTIEAQKGTPTTVTYTNNLIGAGGSPPVLQKYLTVDQTIHWADPLNLMCMFMTPADQISFGYFDPFTGPVPTVVHLHGGEVPSSSDGHPESWFTPTGIHGAGYRTLSGVASNQAKFIYPNGQEATTLWFHDHALGATRLNVYGGLAGFYFLRDGRDTGASNNPIGLPADNQEVELVIQDRQFDTNGQWLFPDGKPAGFNGPPPNPTVHPFWNPEFFGDVIVVNGKSWPFLNVEAKRYRLRFLNGSNARMYNLYFSNKMPFWQIGTDGGFLDTPVKVNQLFLAPGERADVIVDFTGIPALTNIILYNNARAPFPGGSPPDPQTTGQIMQFRVTGAGSADTTCNPAVAGSCVLRESTAQIVRLADPVKGTLAAGVVPDADRQLILREIAGPGGPLEVLINNTKWVGIKESTLTTTQIPLDNSTLAGTNWVTELPRVGSTEQWEIINTTGDAHPIHIHLVQFQLINRQSFQVNKFMKAYNSLPGDGPPNPYLTLNADGAIGGNPAVTPFLLDGTAPPNPNEAGWKDTFVMMPGQVTRVAIRWAPQHIPVGGVSAGTNGYPFDPTQLSGGPGYVWHCHILDHEDNEMMRPYAVAQ